MDVDDSVASAPQRANVAGDEGSAMQPSSGSAPPHPAVSAGDPRRSVLFQSAPSQTSLQNTGVRMPQDSKSLESSPSEKRAAELRHLADNVRAEIAAQARRSADMIDSKAGEEAVRRSNEELERRVSERTAELQKANFALMAEVAERRREHDRLLESERLAAIGAAMNGLAHESRNALQRAQACLEMLIREVEDRPAALAMIARIESAQNDLHRLYEKVRDYASPLRLDPQRQTISSIVREAWLELESLRAARNVRVREVYIGADPNCEVDRRSMTQVFGHLLKNALVACNDPVEIEIAYFDSELNGQPAVKVVVEDNGPGFPADEREKAFTAFYTTNTKGTGLGLAVSKRIVEAHGGEIVLGSNSIGGNSHGSAAKTGAQFIITLPRRKS